MFEHLDDPAATGPDQRHRAAVAVRARALTVRRRLVAAGAAVACIAAAAVPVALAQGSDWPDEVRTIGQPATTLATPEPEETTASSTTVLIPAGPVRMTTLAPPVCRNSFDERCGPFHWDPAPGENAPMRLTITATPSNPKAGEEVTFVVTGEDPDADRLTCQVPQVDYGDGESNVSYNTFCGGIGRIPRAERAYGPWSPPPRLPGTFRSTPFTHTFEAPGEYTVSALWQTGPVPAGYTSPWEGGLWPSNDQGNTALDPYASAGEATFVITVSP